MKEMAAIANVSLSALNKAFKVRAHSMPARRKAFMKKKKKKQFAQLMAGICVPTTFLFIYHRCKHGPTLT